MWRVWLSDLKIYLIQIDESTIVGQKAYRVTDYMISACDPSPGRVLVAAGVLVWKVTVDESSVEEAEVVLGQEQSSADCT